MGQGKWHPAAWGQGERVALIPALEKRGRHLLLGCPPLGVSILWGAQDPRDGVGSSCVPSQAAPSAMISSDKLLKTKPAALTLRGPVTKPQLQPRMGNVRAGPISPWLWGWNCWAGGHAVMPWVPRAPRSSGRERPPAVIATWAPATATGMGGDAFKLILPLCVGSGRVPPPSLAHGAGAASSLCAGMGVWMRPPPGTGWSPAGSTRCSKR